MGGLPRRATFISREASREVGTLILDSGNFVAAAPVQEAAIEPSEAKARIILEAMDRMGYAAVAVGDKDLSLGLDRLRSLSDEAKVRFLSANLLDSDGKAVFEPYLLIKAGGITVGVIGLTSPKADRNILARRAPDVTIADPFEAARGAVEKIRTRCSLLVVLSNIGYARDMELADAVPGIDVIISGASRRYMKRPMLRGSTLVTSGYYEGRAVGRIVFHMDGPVEGWITLKELEFMDRQIAAAETETQIPGTEDRLEALIQKRESMKVMTVYEPDMINLDPSIPDDEKVAGMIRDYRKGLKQNTPEGAAPAAGREQVRYTGAGACSSCHGSRHRFWLTTGHSRAFDSLAPKDAEGDTDCLPCHVTGYMRRTGYWPRAPREDLRGVQCETCHGIGSLHAADPSGYSLLHLPSAPLCLDCHTEEQDGDFDYLRDRSLVCAEEAP